MATGYQFLKNTKSYSHWTHREYQVINNWWMRMDLIHSVFYVYFPNLYPLINSFQYLGWEYFLKKSPDPDTLDTCHHTLGGGWHSLSEYNQWNHPTALFKRSAVPTENS